jgi:hypothetical protein
MSPLLYHWTNFALAVSIVVAQAAVVTILLKRNLRSEFPIFFAYNICSMLAGIALSVGYVSRHVSLSEYFYSYAAVNFVLMLLEFGVMYELIIVALKPYGAIIDLGKMLFRWAGLFLLVAAALTAYATVGSMADRCSAGADLLARSLRLMQCGLLFLFFLFERRLSLSWRSRPVSVAIGIGVSSAIALVFSYLGGRYIGLTRWLNLGEVATYLMAVVYWARCFSVRDAQRTNVLDSPSRLIFQRWNEALSSYGYGNASATPSAVESFLPGIERTVDRVMARRVS